MPSIGTTTSHNGRKPCPKEVPAVVVPGIMDSVNAIVLPSFTTTPIERSPFGLRNNRIISPVNAHLFGYSYFGY